MGNADAAGLVRIVGAGPGDPGLLTLRAARALEEADVVLYDALVGDAILAMAPPSCERIYVGKRSGDHAMPQAEIEALMVRLAREGKRVVRLKGGDPFVFGRGGEEAETLRAHGISFEIVPGITSAIAGPAYAGIPVTHRACNVAFTVATGHEDPTKDAPVLDLSRLAGPHHTTIFLMAMGNLAEIAASLQAHGADAQTPAAVIENATRPDQRTVVGTLATITDDAARAGLRPPAIVVVGEVVRLRERIAWFDAMPLFGKRVLITRPAHQSAAFAHALAMRGVEPIFASTIVIAPPDDPAPAQQAIRALDRYDWLVLTSRNGVDALFASLDARGSDVRALGGLRIAAIGAKTADALRARGIRADLVPNVFTGDAVARALVDAARPGERVLVYRAQEARDVLPRMLNEAGIACDVVAAYKTIVADDPDLEAKVRRADVLTFTSGSTVRGFCSLLGGDERARELACGRCVACIGPITADEARAHGLEPDVVADVYTADGLLDALERRFASHA